jgi:putative hemolysin
MDCGQGSCACIDGKCLATFEGIKPIGGENTEKDSATNTQIANPASKKCIADGGKLEIRENSEGQYGVCLLPDGTECEEWKHFRGEC